MENILRDHPNMVNEVNLRNQNPLHLAIGRPSCVALLLQGPGRKLIDLPDSHGMRPIDYALFYCIRETADDTQYHDGCSRSCGDISLSLLLEADCMVPKTASWPKQKSYMYWSRTMFLCDYCVRTVSPHLVDRRERLKTLAINNLPRMQAATLGLFSPSVLDSNAPRVIQSLNERGISVPTSLQVLDGSNAYGCNDLSSAYHTIGPVPFPVLWDLGFRDIDIPDAKGLTPLMLLCKKSGYIQHTDVRTWSWLIEHGADPWKVVPDGLSTIGHEIYSKLGRTPGYLGSIFRFLRDDFSDLMGKLSHMQRDPRDGCRCACSPGGCTPFVRFLQSAVHYSRVSSNLQKPIASVLLFAKEFTQVLTNTHTSITTVRMQSAVRLASFEVLDIRHTCGCRHDDPSKWERVLHAPAENEEVDELLQEDRFLVDILEDLVRDFDVELESIRQGPDLTSFWDGFWVPRMEETLKSIESADMEGPDKVAAEDVGVIWHTEVFGKDEDYDSGSESGGYHESDWDSEVSIKDKDYDSGSENGGYHESDWDSEVDEKEMFREFLTMDDWISRLGLIMSKAGLPR